MARSNYQILPAVTIDSQKLQYNIEQTLFLLKQSHLNAHFSTTGIAAYEPLIRLMASCGIRNFADSSLDNLNRIRSFAKSTMLSRIPMISEAKRIVQEVDISLNSELETIFALSDAAVVANKKHGIILMLELGDLAEGFLPDEIIDIVHQVLNLRGVELKGIRFCLNTFAGVKTSLDKLITFSNIVTEIANRFEIQLEYISGGNSGTVSFIDNPEFPQNINHLILGQAWLLGKEINQQYRIADLHQDVFGLHAEVVENKRKSSLPDGELGLNYAGKRMTFDDLASIRRVILALGTQDVDFAGLKIKENGIDFIGATSDYSIFNVSKYNRDIRVGDELEFSPDYVALNRIFNSSRIEKVLI